MPTLCRISGQISRKFRGFSDLTTSEISALVDQYATWLMFKLTETGYSTTINDNSYEVVSKMICDVCVPIYERADQCIIKRYPDLSACAIAGNYFEPFDPDKPAAAIASADLTNELENLKRLMPRNLT